jgi:hypothetical protein
MNRHVALALSLFLVACGDDSTTEDMDGGLSRIDGGFPFDSGFDVATDALRMDIRTNDADVSDAGLGDVGPGDSGPGDAGPVTCGDIECRHCVSRGVCLSPIDDCALEELPTSSECSSVFMPCDLASCWEPTLSLPMCGARLIDEDFSSGRFNLHRYDATVPGGEPITLTLERSGGVYQPMLLITEVGGELVFAGDAVTLRPDVLIMNGSTSISEVSVTLQVSTTRMLTLWVTDVEVAADDFSGSINTNATYRLSALQLCEGSSVSESVGSTNSGSLENAAQIASGDGYIVAETGRNAEYGTQETIDFIRGGFAAVRARHPGSQTVQVRDISVENGGRPSGPWPHASHQSGRDVDVTYHLDSCSGACPLADVPLSQFDEEATWTLFEYWLAQGAATFIFVDRTLQQILYDVAGRRGATSEELDRWFQYPSTSATGIIRHAPNHLNHHHVRFRCPVDDSRCVE